MARAFIVRPFGTKEGVDFDRVEKELIAPALTACKIDGRTTGEITQQGNIREDMFRLLVVADIVIADVSIENANVFYELGIRHGLRDRSTFLLRGTVPGQKYPFDLQTDRYMTYDPAAPADKLPDLIAGITTSLASIGTDSPVFKLLPKLQPPDRYVLMVVPPDFQEDVGRARTAKRPGDLRLLAHEASAFEWSGGGLRVVGEAQFKIKAFAGARESFESLRKLDEGDIQSNVRLGTIYQKLAARASDAETKGDLLTQSEQAIERVLRQVMPGDDDTAEKRMYRAEGLSLLGSNAKTRWIDDWSGKPGEERRAAALRSVNLASSLERYFDGFVEDLDAYYPGINALAMQRLQTELAKALPDVWAEGFDSDAKAAAELEERERRATQIATTLQLAFEIDDAAVKAGARKPDRWKEFTKADLLFLTSDKPTRVGAAYRRAFAGADPFDVEAARRNVLLFRALDLRGANVEAALAELTGATTEEARPPARIVLFTGHMLDTPERSKDRGKARFPATPEAEKKAREMIELAVRNEMGLEGGVSLGMAGAACGSDLLFHEVCDSLGIPTRALLALPEDQFQVASVNRAGPDWIERYKRVLERARPRVLADSQDLPRWLVGRPDYDIWQRNNLWMMFNALAEDAPNLTLIALYNPERDPDGPGGTAHMVAEATQRGFKPVRLDARQLLAV